MYGASSVAFSTCQLYPQLFRLQWYGCRFITQTLGFSIIFDHHTVEDIGIVLGQALKQALGNKAGIRRYGHAYVPLDEALSRVVIDLSGRPGLVYNIDFTRAIIGRFDVDLFEEFFHGVVNHSMMTPMSLISDFICVSRVSADTFSAGIPNTPKSGISRLSRS